jgi:NAD(P)H dehydrogenase (quinone)
MSVSAGYLEATVTMAAVARELGVNALVNMSQMTVSQMSIQNTTPSPQQRQHWLSAFINSSMLQQEVHR